jgi:hypothetical protein
MTATSAEPTIDRPCPEWCDDASCRFDSVTMDDHPARSHSRRHGTDDNGAMVVICGHLEPGDPDEVFGSPFVEVFVDGWAPDAAIRQPEQARQLARALNDAGCDLEAWAESSRPRRRRSREPLYAARPIAPHPGYAYGDGGPKPPDDEHDVYGHCAGWCVIDTGSHHGRGAPVEDHGPKCTSSASGVDGVSEDGTAFELYASVVSPYLHGRYRTQDLPSMDDAQPRVELEMIGAGVIPDPDENEVKSVSLSVGEARRLIRQLEHWCDLADGLITHPNTAEVPA